MRFSLNKYFSFIFFLLFLFTILVCETNFAQKKEFNIPEISFNPSIYICNKTSNTITIDGHLSKHEWSHVKWSEEFVDIEGKTSKTPFLITKMKMLWSDEYFYVAAICYNTHIWGNIKTKDMGLYRENAFEIFIDPDNDTHNYYELQINALNTISDLLLIKPYRDGKKSSISSWDFKELKSAVKINGSLNNPSDLDSSWIIEIAIPWESFREVSSTSLPPKDKDKWRLNFLRVHWNTRIINNHYSKILNSELDNFSSPNYWTWSPQGVVNMHYPEMWGYVQFSTQTPEANNISYIVNDDEDIKWQLRQLYYSQNQFYLDNGKYATDLEDLKTNVKSFRNKPTLHSSGRTYHISVLNSNMDKIILIFQDGKIVVESI